MLLGNDVDRKIAVSRDENRYRAIDVAYTRFVPRPVADLLRQCLLCIRGEKGCRDLCRLVLRLGSFSGCDVAARIGLAVACRG